MYAATPASLADVPLCFCLMHIREQHLGEFQACFKLSVDALLMVILLTAAVSLAQEQSGVSWQANEFRIGAQIPRP